jgi:hypothetical protein
MLPLLIGAGLGLAGAIGGMFSRGKANREMEQLLGQDPAYQENPLARQRLGLAQTLLNARMPGAARAEQNIFQNQANAVGTATRAATDSSQLLAAAAGAQGQTNNAVNDLEQQEALDYQRRFNNYEQANQGVINEGDKVFQDQTRRFNDRVQVKGAQAQNRAANWQSLSNAGFGLADFGMSGGFDNLFKKNSGPASRQFLPID